MTARFEEGPAVVPFVKEPTTARFKEGSVVVPLVKKAATIRSVKVPGAVSPTRTPTAHRSQYRPGSRT